MSVFAIVVLLPFFLCLFFLFFAVLCCAAWEILDPQPLMQPVSPEFGAQILSHWATTF